MMATTQKHYAIVRQEKVRESVEAGVSGMMAAVARVTMAAEEKKAAG